MPRNPFKRKKGRAIATTRKLLRTPSVVTQEQTLLGLLAAERAAHDTKLGKSLADSAEKLSPHPCRYVISSGPVTSRRKYFRSTDVTTVTTPLSNYKIIGKGAFGLVYKGQMTCPITDKKDADYYIQEIAVKYIVLDKKVNRRFPRFPRYGRAWRISSPEKVGTEISILNKLTVVKGVVQLYYSEQLVEDEIREDGNGNSITLFPGYYLYLEYCNGGELLDYIQSRGWISRMVSLPETTVQVIILKLVQIMKECHALGVTHRDLKPENILLNLKNPPAERNLWKDCLRINDFGLASTDTEMCHFCGTPGYQSPENAHGLEYTEKTDVWSIGVITYVMLTGKFPFPVGMWNTRISARHYDLDLTKLKTTDSIEFLEQIFTLEADRPSMDELLQLKWLSGLETISESTYIEDLEIQSGGSSTYEGRGRVYKLRKFVARERARKIQEGLHWGGGVRGLRQGGLTASTGTHTSGRCGGVCGRSKSRSKSRRGSSRGSSRRRGSPRSKTRSKK